MQVGTRSVCGKLTYLTSLKMDVAKHPADTLLFFFKTSEQVEVRKGCAEGFVWTRNNFYCRSCCTTIQNF